uniref:Fibronectin type III domain containing 7, related sequence 3 n=1 Tax=Labrus bergylta TaxID=56723 RepID=A0A3Q3FJ43_9LABR
VAVSWEPSKGARSYTTVAQGNGGYASTCTSNETTCVFSDLLCGLNYSITVVASDETPCVPQNVTAQMVCSDDAGIVSWEE